MGILRWAIELGLINMYVEVSQLLQFQVLPRQGHLEAAYHIFAYLKHDADCQQRSISHFWASMLMRTEETFMAKFARNYHQRGGCHI